MERRSIRAAARSETPDAPMGATLTQRGAEFRVWAPRARSASVVIESADASGEHRLDAAGGGFFAGGVDGIGAGTRYRYRIDDGPLLPDPASRFQPHGPHGPSQIVDARTFAWTDHAWLGIAAGREVIYELHIGTFTPQGTWRAAIGELPRLAELGVTLLEAMPVADFPGDFGWGYDGVNLYAPYHGYGAPDDMRAFVDAAHAHGLGVLVDVVYNHFGPDGNYLSAFTPDWIGRHKSEWGDAPNFDGRNSAPVREFYAANAAYWIEDFHADGLRFDATQQILDTSDEHVLHAIVRRARQAAGARRIVLVAENEPQHAELARAAPHGAGCDALWNDDFHHCVRVALTGRADAYYSDYRGSAQEIVSAVRHGFLYQGQRSAWIGKARGTPALDLPSVAFVQYLENHDQVANSARGDRLAASVAPGALRAATALLLLTPAMPMLFQGQEYASLRPFLYFAHHNPQLAAAVREGRGGFLAQFACTRAPGVADGFADPAARATFDACKLDPRERDTPRARQALALVADLLRLRREDAVIGGRTRRGSDGAVLTDGAFVLRLFAHDGGDRLLLVNLGADLTRATIAEPLLAPPSGARWSTAWSSEDPRYGGSGGYPLDADAGWRITGRAATLLAARPQ